MCVPPPPVNEPCGTCDLGYLSCGDGAARSCVDPAIPTVDRNAAACPKVTDGARGTSNTFVYLDSEAAPENTDGGDMEGSEPPSGPIPDGSPDNPFTDYASALSAAGSRNASIIVIAGSGVLNPIDAQGDMLPLQVFNDISLLGGFDADFAPDPSQRPRIIGVVNDVADEPSFVAVVVKNLTLPTALEHIAIETSDVPDGALDDPTFEDPDYGRHPNNYGVWLTDSTGGLSLLDVTIEMGAAGVVDSPIDGWSAAVFCTSGASVVSLDPATTQHITVPTIAGPPGAIVGKVVNCRQEER